MQSAPPRGSTLDEVENLNHVVPTLGASVVPETGGVSTQKITDYHFDVTEPRDRCLLAVKRAEVTVAGRDPQGRFETELEVQLEQLDIVEKLHIDYLRLHLLAVRTSADLPAAVSTSGNQLEGMRLGKVQVKVEFDAFQRGRRGATLRKGRSMMGQAR
jgi:hypothetical protein